MWCQPAQVRDTDLDALERVVSIVAFGDVEAEGPPGAVADVSLRRLLRLSQLANEYLLHVQDHLATRHNASKVRSGAMHISWSLYMNIQGLKAERTGDVEGVDCETD